MAAMGCAEKSTSCGRTDVPESRECRRGRWSLSRWRRRWRLCKIVRLAGGLVEGGWNHKWGNRRSFVNHSYKSRPEDLEQLEKEEVRLLKMT